MLPISIYNQKLKSINEYLFGKKYDSDKNTKLEKIKEFQEVLTKFVQDHKETVSVNDIKQFINGKKQNLSEIGVKDPEGKLLYVLLFIYENNDLHFVQDFLNLISDFDIQDVRIVFHIKGHIYRCYVCSQNCTYDVFKKAVDDLLSCNYLSMQTFKNFIDQCFSQDKDKKLIKQDCFNCIFELLKERFNEEKIKNIRYVEYLCVIIIYTFGYDVIKSADKSIFEYILNLTKNTFALGSSDACFSDWFKVFSHFKAEFWNSSDLKDECWIAQYNRFHNMTLDFLAANSYKRNSFYLYPELTDKDIVIDRREDYKQAVQEFLGNKDILPETRLIVMYFCSELYGTDTEFLKEMSADSFSSIDSFFSNCEKVQLKNDLADCLSVFSTDTIAGFIKRHNDINENNRWKFLAMWKSIVKRCKGEKSSVRITNFFPTPNDLFNFYKKIKPEFSYKQFLNIKDSKKQYKDIQDIYSEFRDLDVCLQKYDNDEIANFIKENNEPCESLFIYVCLRESFNYNWWERLFSKPEDIIDFYINKVPDEFKNLEYFYIFLHVGHMYEDKKLWQNYFKSILNKKNQKHIQLFLDLFDSKINFYGRVDIYDMDMDYKRKISKIMEIMFKGFDDLKSFLDFYMEIHSNLDKNLLEKNNADRDCILQLMINRCSSSNHCHWNLTASLLDVCDKKYDFCVPSLINKITWKEYLDVDNLSCIVQFLNKKNDLNQDLKNQLLKKIDNQVKKRVVELLGVSYDETLNRYNSDAFIDPNEFQSKLKYVIEIMNSKEVLPETKKKIYDWAKDAIAEDEYKWQCVLEMYVWYIEDDKKYKNDKNNQYEHLRDYSIGDLKLTTLNSHQGDWYLADLKNSNELRNLNAQINNLNNQIDTLQNKLNKTEFKLGWILIIWLSGIGTFILLGLRYYWDSSKNSLDNTKNTLSTQKQNLENTIKTSCEKKKADYENSLAQAKEEMKKWGKCEESKNYPYDKHEEYYAGLNEIIDIYAKDYGLGQNLNQDIHIKDSGGEISPLEEQKQEKDNIIIYKDWI